MRLADPMNSHPIGCRWLTWFELRAELARDHAARLVHFDDPRAAQKIRILVHSPFYDLRPEPEPPRISVARERFPEQREILPERIPFNQKRLIALCRRLVAEHGEDGVV